MKETPEEKTQRLREQGRKGGLAKVKKGLAKLPTERVQEIARMGGKAGTGESKRRHRGTKI